MELHNIKTNSIADKIKPEQDKINKLLLSSSLLYVFFLMREKERVWNCVGGKWEDLGGVEERRTVIRIHWMKKNQRIKEQHSKRNNLRTRRQSDRKPLLICTGSLSNIQYAYRAMETNHLNSDHPVNIQANDSYLNQNIEMTNTSWKVSDILIHQGNAN